MKELIEFINQTNQGGLIHLRTWLWDKKFSVKEIRVNK